MATKIVTKNSSTASAVPTASDLVQGELAVNVADKRLFTEDNGGSIIELGTNPSTIDINAGSIDGTAIGASSASTGAFTTLTATGLTVDTNTLYVDSTNNRVGVGTTSPTVPLHVNGGTDNQIGLIESTDATVKLGFKDDSTTNNYSVTVGAVGNEMTFTSGSGGTERMRIDSSGRVGIGTTSPSVPVHVYKSQASPTIVAKFENPADEAIVEIKSKNTDLGVLQFADTEDANVGAVQYSHSDNSMRFKTNDSERMRIDSSGNVKIGNPNKGVSDADEGILFSGALPGLSYFTRDGGLATSHARLNSYGGVIRVVANGNSAGQIGSGSSGALSFYNGAGSTERARIDSSGNLLVGTTVSPASGDPTSVRYGIGVQAGSLSSTTTCTAGVITNVLNMANAVSGVNGAGLWLISVIRGGASYATHFTGVFGVNSSSMVLYQTIQSAGITVSVNGLQLRLNVSTTDGYRVNAIPLSINT